MHRIFQDPAKASLFLLPVLMHISFYAGYCLGSTHKDRMNAMADTLQKSPHFRKSTGKNHILICNDWQLIRSSHFLGKPLTRYRQALVPTCPQAVCLALGLEGQKPAVGTSIAGKSPQG